MPLPTPLPRVIQGGMGVAVSNWRLANAVSRTGQLGVVSGSMLDTVFVRRLQDGDSGGHLRRAIAAFPDPAAAERILDRYFHPGGLPAKTAYKLLPMYKQRVTTERNRVTVLASFAEVWLAKEGHRGAVGINLLTKVQLPNLASLYGAMLAGVDAVIMGAGIPREIPGVLDALAVHSPVKLKLEIEGLGRDEAEFIEFDPARCMSDSVPDAPLSRPDFIAVISASSLATTLARKSSGRVDGFVIEGPTAGGHNAPPRGELRLSDSGEPLYGERDVVDLEKIRELGLPFWLAGGVGSPDGLRDALAQGAAGIQVGTLFAYCDESGLAPDLKRRVLAAARTGNIQVRTDPRASPTGFPFKVVIIGGDEDMSEKRERNCDLGYLRVPVRMPDGRTVYRCSAEPIEDYIRKGGTAADAEGRRCLCNGLTAAIGQAQWSAENGREIPLITSGDDLKSLAALGSPAGYRAQDVLEYLVSS